MRCLPVLLIFFAVHLVTASIDDENSVNEIPYQDPIEEIEMGVDNDKFTPLDNDLDEGFIFSEDNEHEEIEFRSMSQYIQISEIISSDDDSNSYKSEKDEIQRKDSPIKSQPGESKLRKKRQASCTNNNQPTFKCDAKSKYRLINGTCNNLKHPEWGMGLGCQERILRANYKGKSDFRESVKGGPLPEPRNISLYINTDEDYPEKHLNHMLMFFGQFIAHEIVLTPLFSEATGEILSCCQLGLRNDPRCATNIYIPKNDPFYKPLNISCLTLPRAVSCNSCDEKGRKFLNLNTAFLDGSIVYGSSEANIRYLRANDGTGKLKSQMTRVGELLPNSSNPQHDQCSFPDQDLICFEGGDARANQHILITCLQTIFLRLHNRMASKLKEINPAWDQERIFQETRRIVAAMIQVITFKEYLPIVLNPKWISLYKLGLSDGFTTYDDTLNPSIWLEFSIAAFRVPHSSINTVVSTEPRPVTEGFQLLRDLYFRPFGLRNGGFGPLILDTTRTPAQMVDRFSVKDANGFLFGIFGDLGSFDIQRGRDVGLPTYVQMVQYCHKINFRDFDDPTLFLFIRPSEVKLLKNNYKSLEDVDLETALQMEIKEKLSIFGPTSACIVALQFRNLKYGDRFYFEHGNQVGSFTKDQKNELKKTSLTQIICKTVDGISDLPENAMLFINPLRNRKVNCKDVKDLDLSKWKE